MNLKNHICKVGNQKNKLHLAFDCPGGESLKMPTTMTFKIRKTSVESILLKANEYK